MLYHEGADIINVRTGAEDGTGKSCLAHEKCMPLSRAV